MIKKAIIFAANYKHTLRFYQDIFGPLIQETGDSQFQVQLQENVLEVQQQPDDSSPSYHFSFLIPYRQFASAKQFVSSKVPLNIQDEKDEISFVPGIRSFYFEDPSGNILEFMGKENIISESDTFTPDNIRLLNEMSLVPDSILEAAETLAEAGILKKDPSSINQDKLNFISSDETTLLLSPKDRIWLFSDKKSAVFPQTVLLEDKQIEINQNGQLSIEEISF